MADDEPGKVEEHVLPSVEALLACTLALMTGYSQALQAATHPRQRLFMGEQIAGHLVSLVGHPLLSVEFKQVLLGLQGRWQAMDDCTRNAAQPFSAESAQGSSTARHSSHAADDDVQRRRLPLAWLH